MSEATTQVEGLVDAAEAPTETGAMPHVFESLRPAEDVIQKFIDEMNRHGASAEKEVIERWIQAAPVAALHRMFDEITTLNATNKEAVCMADFIRWYDSHARTQKASGQISIITMRNGQPTDAYRAVVMSKMQRTPTVGGIVERPQSDPAAATVVDGHAAATTQVETARPEDVASRPTETEINVTEFMRGGGPTTADVTLVETAAHTPPLLDEGEGLPEVISNGLKRVAKAVEASVNPPKIPDVSPIDGPIADMHDAPTAIPISTPISTEVSTEIPSGGVEDWELEAMFARGRPDQRRLIADGKRGRGGIFHELPTQELSVKNVGSTLLVEPIRGERPPEWLTPVDLSDVPTHRPISSSRHRGGDFSIVDDGVDDGVAEARKALEEFRAPSALPEPETAFAWTPSPPIDDAVHRAALKKEFLAGREAGTAEPAAPMAEGVQPGYELILHPTASRAAREAQLEQGMNALRAQQAEQERLAARVSPPVVSWPVPVSPSILTPVVPPEMPPPVPVEIPVPTPSYYGGGSYGVGPAETVERVEQKLEQTIEKSPTRAFKIGGAVALGALALAAAYKFLAGEKPKDQPVSR